MRKKQQTLEIKTADETNNLPFESELNSFIKKASGYGWTKKQSIKYLEENWDKLAYLELSKEMEKENEFREKVKVFMDSKYEEFDAFAYNHYFRYCGGWRWTRFDEVDAQVKRNFIYEVAYSLYKEAFKMDSLNRELLKTITVERTKILFPSIRAHSQLFYLALSALLEYVEYYEVEEECETFLKQYEVANCYDMYMCKFVWIVENFQP